MIEDLPGNKMGLMARRTHSHPRTKVLNWVRSCTMGCRDDGARDIRVLGGRDGHGGHDDDGDHDVHGVRDALGASSQYPSKWYAFSCVYDDSGAQQECEACGGDDGGDDAPSLACDDDDEWLSPSCGDHGV